MSKSTSAIAAALLVTAGVSAAALAAGKAHWSYEGKEGPAHWGKIVQAQSDANIFDYPLVGNLSDRICLFCRQGWPTIQRVVEYNN